ncbi:MAG: 30S ribosomal protein S6 [Candidatus Doudnabacteria bacterium]|nr:30S ribosomal protein S6 [Candidatus Doudnabacteria bacterium]
MPKYELMYILSSAVSDDEVPNVVAEIELYLKQQNATILSKEMLGKKKLAYPIKKTRNGFYVLQTFNLAGEKLEPLNNKIRSITQIIRYIIVNLEEMERQKTKTQALQEKLKLSRKPKKIEPVPVVEQEIKLTDTELEKKIETALESEDLTK